MPSDRETVIRLRHDLQSCESIRRTAARKLVLVRETIAMKSSGISIQSLVELLAAMSDVIDLLLDGDVREGGIA